jgi:DNA replication and repair protein RecF
VSVEALQVQNLRSVVAASLELHPHQNLIWGANGAGKTSFLEALYLLGRGRSFRTRRTERLIRQGEDSLTVVGRTFGATGHTIGFGCSRMAGSTARVDGETVTTFASLTRACPTQSIDPSIHHLLEEGPVGRRQWLDWTVFHVEPGFFETWARYGRALKQRNAALRSSPATALAWDVELASLGESLSAARARTLERMQPVWERISTRLVPVPIALTFNPGWSRDLALAEALTAARPRDQMRGTTSVGAHRADVHVRCEGRAATEVLSRGQQKLTAISLILAQLEFVQPLAEQPVMLLLDDAAAELDAQSLLRFKAELQRLEAQQVWTSLTPNTPDLSKDSAVFHVEQGRVEPV